MACTPPRDAAPRPLPVQVAVSVAPQAYLVDRIGGERVKVQVMVPPATSPDSYEPTPQQILQLGRARLYVAVGHVNFPFERRFLDRVREIHPDLPVVDMAQGIGDQPGAAPAATDPAELDPHVWLSPVAMSLAARNIAAALERLDPAGATLYRRHLAALESEIAALDAELATTLAGLERRRFLVYHPAWGYFAARYGLEQVAIEEGGKEPSPAGLVALIERARRDGVRVVFVQLGFSDRSARVVASEIGARVVALDPLAYDWPRSLREAAAAFREGLGR